MKKILFIIFLLLTLLFFIWFISEKWDIIYKKIQQTEKKEISSKHTAPPLYVPVIALKGTLQKNNWADLKSTSNEIKSVKTLILSIPSKKINIDPSKTESPPKIVENNNKNSMPNLVASYEMPITDYLKFMESKGGKIIVYDLVKNKPVCVVESPERIHDYPYMVGFSNFSRRITDDYPGKKLLMENVEMTYGTGNYEIILILPESVVQNFYTAISNILKSRGLNIVDVTTCYLIYKGSKTNFIVYVDKVVGTFGTLRIMQDFTI